MSQEEFLRRLVAKLGEAGIPFMVTGSLVSGYHGEEFERRTAAELLGQTIPVVSPEDSILSKLVWARRASSERQIRDARGIVAAVGQGLDREYLRRWAGELGVAEELEKILGG